MKRAIILSGLMVALVSMVGVQGAFAKNHTGNCAVTGADGTVTNSESTGKDCKAKGGTFTPKAGKAKKAK